MNKEQRRLLHRLVMQHGEDLTALAYRLTGDWSLAEDLVQETFLTACYKVDQLSCHPNPAGWLYTTLHNHIRRELRRAQHNELPFDEAIGTFTASDRPLAQLLPEKLPLQERELLLLRIEQGLSIRQLAQHFGITEAACRQRLSRAVKHSRALLETENH